MRNYTYSLAVLLMASIAYAGITADNKFDLNQHAGSAAHGVRLGTLVDQPGSLSVVWNSSTGNLGSSTLVTGARRFDGSTRFAGTPGRHNLGVSIPQQSLITRARVEVTVPVRTAGTESDIGPAFSANHGISFHCSTKSSGKTTVDLSSSTLYNNAALNSAPGGLFDLDAVDTILTMQRNDSTEDCNVQADITGTDALSGKITLFIEYMQIR